MPPRMFADDGNAVLATHGHDIIENGSTDGLVDLNHLQLGSLLVQAIDEQVNVGAGVGRNSVGR